MQKLISAGADANLSLITNGITPDKHEGYSPLMIAIDSWKEDQDFRIIDLLLQLDINKSHCDIYGKTALSLLLDTSLITSNKIRQLLEKFKKDEITRSMEALVDSDKYEERLYYANAVIFANDPEGDLSVLLCEIKGDDWVSRLSFPKERQHFARDASLVDTAKWITQDLTGIDLLKACPDGGRMIFSENEKRKGGKVGYQQQFYFFKLDNWAPLLDLRPTRACAPAKWVKLKELPVLEEQSDIPLLHRCHYHGSTLSPIAIEMIRSIERGEKIEENPKVQQAFFCEREGFKQLSEAVKQNNTTRIRQLIAMGVDPNAEGNLKSDGSALLQAFKLNNEPMARLLLSLGASPAIEFNQPWFFGGNRSLLSVAIGVNSFPLVKLLEEAEVTDFNDPLSIHNAAIGAAKAEDPRLLEFFLKRHRQGKKFAELLVTAAQIGRPRNVEQLLRYPEFSMKDLKRAILAANKLGDTFDEKYLKHLPEYTETLQLLLRVGCYDDETLSNLLQEALYYGLPTPYLQELLDKDAARYAPKEKFLLQNLCRGKKRNEEEELSLAHQIHTQGQYYNSYFIKRAIEEDKIHLVLPALKSGDLDKETVVCKDFFKSVIQKQIRATDLLRQGLSINAHDQLGKSPLHYLVEAQDAKPVYMDQIVDLLELGANPFAASFYPGPEIMLPLITVIERSGSQALKTTMSKWLLQSQWAAIYAAYLSDQEQELNRAPFEENIEKIKADNKLRELFLQSGHRFALRDYKSFLNKDLLSPVSDQVHQAYCAKVKERMLPSVELFWLLAHTFPALRTIFASRNKLYVALQEQILRSLRQLEAQIFWKKEEYNHLFSCFPDGSRLLGFIVLLAHVELALSSEDWPKEERESLVQTILQQGGFSPKQIAFAKTAIGQAGILSDIMRGAFPLEDALKCIQTMAQKTMLSLRQCYELKMLMELCLNYGDKERVNRCLKKHAEDSSYLTDNNYNGELYYDLYVLSKNPYVKRLGELMESRSSRADGGATDPSSASCPSVKAVKTRPYYKINGNPAISQQGVHQICLKIGYLPEEIALTKENLGTIFGIANRYSYDIPYPLHNKSLSLCGIKIHRPNHNGTHGARQARYLQELFLFIATEAAPQIQQIFSQFNEEYHNNLLVGAYFLRSGRVDERSHQALRADDYYTRSAMIYGEYAKQLKLPEKSILQMQLLIKNSCKPRGVREESIDKDPSLKLCYELLTLAHELDLVRCYGQKQFISNNLPMIKARLGYLLGSEDRVETLTTTLLALTKRACEATGAFSVYHQAAGDRERFARCSTDGTACWHAL